MRAAASVPGLGSGSFDYYFYKQMALAYDAQGNYVIVDQRNNWSGDEVDMSHIRNLPHCVTDDRVLCWYEGDQMHGFDFCKGAPMQIETPRFKIHQLLFSDATMFCIGHEKVAAYREWRINNVFALPAGGYCTCIKHKSHERCEAIVDGFCYELFPDFVHAIFRMHIESVFRTGIQTGITWDYDRLVTNGGYWPMHFGNVLLYYNDESGFVAVDETTGVSVRKYPEFPISQIIDVKMNASSILVHTETRQYIGSTYGYCLYEFEGSLEYQAPTKSARS